MSWLHHKGTFARKTILFALALPVAILANLLRLVALLLIGSHWGVEVAMTFSHDFFNSLFFGVSILCLVLLAGLLRRSGRLVSSQFPRDFHKERFLL
ncbi:MAG: hypothetical protein DDT24_00143 [Chloroflexi bacterium]|nr:hypothetical protein [Chloroflexota bacterium]